MTVLQFSITVLKKYTVKPVYRNLKFKNLSGQHFHFKPPFHKNLFSLEFSIGSYFPKMNAQMKIQKKKF